MPLLVTHGYPNANKFEVIDLYNDNALCENLDDDAIFSGIDAAGATGGLVNKQPLLCYGDYCHVLGQSKKIELNEDRRYFFSIVIGNKVSCQNIYI